jgi:Xaa-Pro aminopeptidase
MTAPALPAMDVAGRAGRLRARLDDAGCDGLLVTNVVNVRWLTGFTGSAGVVLVLSDELLVVTDFRYRDQASDQLAAAGVDARLEISSTDQQGIVSKAARGIARIGLEAATVTWAQQRRFAGEWFSGADVVATEGLVEELRQIKDHGEVARIAAAAGVADKALAAVRSRIADGPTERDIALDLEVEMRRRGAEAAAFETIVGSGPNGARPHARAGDRRIRPGDLVVLDFGAVVDGYRSDMTRTVVVGEPSGTQRRMLDVVAESQRAGVAAARDGVSGGAVDRACREVIEAAGWGDSFLHGTGHGVGLDIHEAPRLSAQSDDMLAAGQVVTVEPGVYLPEHGGVRIEDTVAITATGCDILTNAPKDPGLT